MNYIKKHTHLLILAGIVIIASFIRLEGLTTIPPLDVDEYGIFYNAFSISQYGIDEWGKSFPLFFRSFGDYKLAFDIYLSASLFKIFEPSVFWLRFPSIVFSVLYIPFVYLLIKHITKSSHWGLLGGIIIAFLPTSIFYSHLIGASISASFLIFASFTVFILGFQRKKPMYYVLSSSLLLSLSLYAYPLSWIVSPLLTICFAYMLWREGYMAHIAWYAIVAIAFIPILFQFFVGGSAIRVSNTSAFSTDRGPYLETQQFRQAAENDLLSKVFHNKPLTSAYVFAGNYLKHFSIPYLSFEKSPPQIQVSPYPPLYFVLLPFYLYGLFLLVKNRSKPEMMALIFFVLIAPLPSAITDGAVHPKRYLASLGLETILVVLAFRELYARKHTILVLVFAIIFFGEFLQFFSFFNGSYRQDTDQLFYAKARSIERIAKDYWPKSHLFYTSENLGEPQIYPLVGALYSPVTYQKTRVAQIENNWVFVKGLENITYNDDVQKMIQALQNNTEYPSYGVFSRDEIDQFPSNICYEIIDTKDAALLSKSYLSVRFKECLP